MPAVAAVPVDAGGAQRHAQPASFTAVLTRPAGQSDVLAARLAQAGIASIDLPLLTIDAASDPRPLDAVFDRLDDYALLVFVSPNAVMHAAARWRTRGGWPEDFVRRAPPLAVVGPGSLRALQAAGLDACTTVSPAGAAAMADELAAALAPGSVAHSVAHSAGHSAAGSAAATTSGASADAAADPTAGSVAGSIAGSAAGRTAAIGRPPAAEPRAGHARAARGLDGPEHERRESRESNEPRFDSEALLTALALHWPDGLAALRQRRVALIRGDGGRELLGDSLRKAGAQVDAVTAYRRAGPRWDDAQWRTVLDGLGGVGGGGGTRRAWLVSSSEAVRHFAAAARQRLDLPQWDRLRTETLIVPHQRIAEAARQCGFDTIRLSGPGDAAIARAFLDVAAEQTRSV
ncbi:uroporphyrinogen-III synthase [Chitinasiproducens palmae]|uniref:Uroporphyrinogen-III synthase n=1 Tax=Chitinasiproducens palmae TaxID=1770053 RepID=A0A1H2PMW6_9BURK|nr:uroporphyrinogen-III synthase [Chitinasiproducens palmae]SDV47976.1 uroporphyrinogen III methyltransferase / synthase [Chitinasiproducens palmae]